MRGNPEVGHDRASVLTRLKETVEAAKLAKKKKCELCDELAPELYPVKFSDGVHMLCMACLEDLMDTD